MAKPCHCPNCYQTIPRELPERPRLSANYAPGQTPSEHFCPACHIALRPKPLTHGFFFFWLWPLLALPPLLHFKLSLLWLLLPIGLAHAANAIWREYADNPWQIDEAPS